VIAKEIRALVPAWTAASAGLVACALLRDLSPFGIPAYFIGAATLGAMSTGHEFGSRTLPLMLTLPVPRRRILLTKLVVLGAFLLLLGASAAVLLPYSRGAREFRTTVLWLPFFAGLFITPYLTTITRSPVAGAVFTMGISGILMIAGEWIGVAKYGYTRDVDQFRVAFIWQTGILLCAAAAIAMWRVFTRLEAIDGAGPAVDLAPRAAVTSTSLTRRHVTWLLIEKELRLQQLAFAVAALYAGVSIAAAILSRGRGPNVLGFVTILYAGMLTLLIGATASAEERHLRTLDAQLLQPVDLSRQWLIKSGVVVVMTLLLAVLLPGTLAVTLMTTHIGSNVIQTLFFGKVILMLLSLSAVSVYVSTLCASGLWALLWSIPSAFAVVTAANRLIPALHAYLYSLDGRPDWQIVEWASGLGTLAVILVILRLALSNHRSADRPPARVLAHIGVVAGAMIAAAGVVAIVGALSR
jgi:hypothetical protein